MVTLLGMVAALLTTLAFVPQVVRAWRTRQTRDLSMGTFVLLISGTLLWLAYGILRRDWPVIMANVVTTLLVVCVIAAKLRFD